MRVTLLLMIATALWAPACTRLEPEPDRIAQRAQRGALLRAQEALEREDYARAIEHADRALRLKTPPPGTDAEIALLKAGALDALGRPGEAAQLYRYVTALHGGSRQASRAAARLEELAARGVDVSPRGPDATREAPLTVLQTSRLLVEREWLEEPVEVFYPFRAEAEDLEGFVVVQLESDPEGRLAAWQVVTSSHPLLEDAVVRSLPRFRFVPEEMAKSDPPNTRTLRFTFRLRDG
jgi:TonB family protein